LILLSSIRKEAHTPSTIDLIKEETNPKRIKMIKIVQIRTTDLRIMYLTMIQITVGMSMERWMETRRSAGISLGITKAALKVVR